jgi:hypothetical protein
MATLRGYAANHFLWRVDEIGVARLTLNRPEKRTR